MVDMPLKQTKPEIQNWSFNTDIDKWLFYRKSL